ncbi:phosphoglycerol transferase MdoB-like AlkP superfamily enzyme [Melghiribacillus thermohalophilus]|uniref:Phosphoglycerol transferase MdoB-like AlkP superfamily enzyme n=1 Tax=Melghiribacillus thermohalophilus TaxID=1324956 RepID=A0A4R3NE76_9BACI|nr:LTA synthase family protein [Melghiribacillus thermohalophilus]TCT26965.1 phosphoglycerol transferase MdoB-like AlkP superfamily enzyme [Melghiribacillus thermohalophilus]
MKNVIKLPVFLIASLLFGLKTYIVYRFLFDLKLENTLQEFILFLNPFATSILLFSIAVLMKPQRQKKYIKIMMISATLLLYFNLVYYRNFTDFITFSVFLQVNNASDLGSSILTLIKFWDVLLFLDVFLVFYLLKKREDSIVFYPLRKKLQVVGFSLTLLFANLFLAEMERPMLFLRGFDREYLVKYVGLFNYHIYDAFMHSKTRVQKVMADESELVEIEDYVQDHIDYDEHSDLEGVARGKNIIYISAESVQSFVLNRTINGQEITPFLNDLIEESYYFENFYHQTNLGKTSDSEFLIEAGLYPLPNGPVFMTHPHNEYHAVPEIIKDYGYYSAVFHANNKSFWNRDVMYESLGYDHFYSKRYYNVHEDNIIGWGLNDKVFFEQSIKYLQSIPEPYYVKFITLTNHFPFELDEKDANIDQYDSNSNTLNHYFPTVRYTDEAIQQFFELLKQSGIYEDSIIIIYGDHYGISEYHNKAMGQFLGKEITPYDNVQLQRVPLIIHIPGHEGKKFDKIAGQIDLKPTMLHLLGMEYDQDIRFGTNLFSEDRKPFVALRNGDFITDEYVFTENICYDRLTGAEVEMSNCEPFEEQVLQELQHSDNLIYGDLLRFYNFDDQEK